MLNLLLRRIQLWMILLPTKLMVLEIRWKMWRRDRRVAKLLKRAKKVLVTESQRQKLKLLPPLPPLTLRLPNPNQKKAKVIPINRKSNLSKSQPRNPTR